MTDIKYKHIALDIYTLLLLAVIIFKNVIFLYNLPKKTKHTIHVLCMMRKLSHL